MIGSAKLMWSEGNRLTGNDRYHYYYRHVSCFQDRVKQQVFTVACTFGAIIVIAIVVKFCSNVSPLVAAISISVFNAIFPMFAKMLTSCEAHSSEGGKQRSLYLKIAVFRWVNTAVVITIIKPFTLTLAKDDGLIPQIYALFFAEIVTTNLSK
jgi:Calcium-activated chloride channel